MENKPAEKKYCGVVEASCRAFWRSVERGGSSRDSMVALMELFDFLEKFLDVSWGLKEGSWESLDCSRVYHWSLWGDFCTLGEGMWYEFKVKMMPKTVWSWIL